MTKLAYHVGEHNGGYRRGDVWLETFADHNEALTAAERQYLKGRDAEISYQLPDGRWQSEHIDGGGRPDTEIVDDEAGAPK